MITIEVENKNLIVKFYTSSNADKPYATNIHPFVKLSEVYITCLQEIKKAYAKLLLPHLIMMLTLGENDD